MELINRSLRGLILTVMLLIGFISFSQIKMTAITTGNYACLKNGVEVDKHNLLQKASTHCDELAANYPNSDIRYTYPIATRITVKGFSKSIEIDTVTIYGFWHTYGQYGAYFRLLNGGDIIKVKTDTVMNWQKDIEVIRTKTFGKVSYENTNKIPFQVRKIYLTEATDMEVRLNVNITEKQNSIKGYLDNELYIKFNPGTSTKITDTDYYFYFYIKGLIKGQEYKFRIEVESINGNINYENISIIL